MVHEPELDICADCRVSYRDGITCLLDWPQMCRSGRCGDELDLDAPGVGDAALADGARFCGGELNGGRASGGRDDRGLGRRGSA